MSEELKPCPFCGSYHVRVCTIPTGYKLNPRVWYVKCNDCESRGSQVFDKSEAITAWNARAAHGTLAAEQVRESIEKRFDFDVWVPKERWQAIADELSARTELTCKNVCKEWEKTNCTHAVTSFCCSECGAHYVDCESYYAGLADANEKHIRTNYCPNCGAKVVGE